MHCNWVGTRPTIAATAVLLGLSALPSMAVADGGYLAMGLGGTATYRDARRGGSGGFSPSLGIGATRGAWAIELHHTAAYPNAFYIDCYPSDGNCNAPPETDYSFGTLFLRRGFVMLENPPQQPLKFQVRTRVSLGLSRVSGDLGAFDGASGLGLVGGLGFDVGFSFATLTIDGYLSRYRIPSDCPTCGGDLEFRAILVGFQLGWGML